MASTLQTRLLRAFQLTGDLAAHLDEASRSLDLHGLPSNRTSGQLWCVVGARESYLRAIGSGEWKGFSCSLNAPHVQQDVLNALESTRRQWSEQDFTNLTKPQEELAFALLEHEVQRHGQLIRFVYGNGLTFPKSWNVRYTV